LADLIIYQLPRIIQQLDTKVIMIADLLNLFIQNPNIDRDEAILLMPFLKDVKF
jgi:hypothetical protein